MSAIKSTIEDLGHLVRKDFKVHLSPDEKDIIEIDDLESKENELGIYFYELPENYVRISNRLDEIVDLIKYEVATKDDIKVSTRLIIEQQAKEISDAKKLIKDLINEIRNRSISKIFTWISLAGLIFSLAFLFLSFFQEVIILRALHFIVLSIFFSIVLVMSILSKNLN